jgi:hypothetical protein
MYNSRPPTLKKSDILYDSLVELKNNYKESKKSSYLTYDRMIEYYKKMPSRDKNDKILFLDIWNLQSPKVSFVTAGAYITNKLYNLTKELHQQKNNSDGNSSVRKSNIEHIQKSIDNLKNSKFGNNIRYQLQDPQQPILDFAEF